MKRCFVPCVLFPLPHILVAHFTFIVMPFCTVFPPKALTLFVLVGHHLFKVVTFNVLNFLPQKIKGVEKTI